MATLDWHVTTREGVTLVRLLVTSEATERVRVTNRLDGPVWPPRRQGVPEEGWDGDGFEGVVAADERLVLGYACPADPCDPPARVASLGSDDAGTAATAREVVRSLGDPSPPRDAVAASGVDAPRSDTIGYTHVSSSVTPSWRNRSRSYSRQYDVPASGTGADWATVEAWLDQVGGRVEDAERLAGVSSVPEATAALTAVGGADDAAALVESLETDRRRVERVARQCETLASRLDDVDVPVETLARLA